MSSNSTLVFNEQTLKSAFETWYQAKVKSAPEKETAFMIVGVSLPYFMQCFQSQNVVYIISEEEFELQLYRWKNLQLANFPHQQERIDECVDLLSEFFHSPIIDSLKMRINTH